MLAVSHHRGGRTADQKRRPSEERAGDARDDRRDEADLWRHPGGERDRQRERDSNACDRQTGCEVAGEMAA